MKPGCLHISAGGTFTYYGEGPGVTRTCQVCGYTEECHTPNPETPHYVQWRAKNKLQWTETEEEQLRIIEDCVINMLRCLQNPPEKKQELLDIIQSNSDILVEAEEELDFALNPEEFTVLNDR